LKNYLDKKWLVVLLVNMVITEVAGSSEKRSAEDYSFILLMPSAESDSGRVAVVFPLDTLKVCRFPNGPMWSNSIAAQTFYLVSQQAYTVIKKEAQKLHILCLDYGVFKSQCQNDCQQSICGFALPWEPGMAYVFDDLKDIDQVSGLLIEKTKLAKLELGLPLNKSEFLTVNSEPLDDGMNLDEIDLLVAGNTDDEYAGKYLPYPFQDIKNFFGKIVISCLMRYHTIRQKMITLLGKYYARSKT